MMSGSQASPDRDERLDCQFCIEELQTLLAAQRVITSSLEPNLVLQSTAEEALRITSTEMSAVYLFKKNRLEVFAVSGGFQKRLLGHVVPAEGSLAGTAIFLGQSLFFADTHHSGSFYSPIVERFQARAVLVVPLNTQNGAIGAVLVANRRPDSLSLNDLRLLEQMAASAVVAIDNARRFISAQQAAVHEERRRIARKVQGAVYQTLFSAALIADVLPRLWDRDPQEGRNRMEELRQITRVALAEMRNLLQDD
jgi:GAF domain-containing protein